MTQYTNNKYMTKNRFSAPKAAFAALAVLLSSATAGQAGPFNGPEAVAVPGGGNNNFVQLKQVSGFTGQMGFNYVGDGGYNPVGAPFNKYIKLSFSVNCPVGYRVNEAGIRVRGDDVFNFDFELVSPGDVPVNQNTWQQALEQEPWDFDTVVAIGIDAVDGPGYSGPVFISLDEVMDSRTEYYGSCVASDPFSGLPFLYYDSHADNNDMRPMTRVRFQLQNSFAVGSGPQIKAPAVKAVLPQKAQRLRHRERAVVAVPGAKPKAFKANGGCPYDCPPPAAQRRLAR